MKKSLFLLFLLSAVTSSYAQFSAGVMTGAGYLFQRTTSVQPNSTLLGVEAAQPVAMAGLFGQYTGKKLPVFVGVQVRYQWQRQSQRFSAMNLSNPTELAEPQFNRYEYIVATPYVGIRPLKNLDIAVGPEISFLQRTRLVSFNRAPTETLLGYNVKATYHFGRLSFEGGYTKINTAFDLQKQQNGVVQYSFFSRYVYGALKFSLIN